MTRNHFSATEIILAVILLIGALGCDKQSANQSTAGAAQASASLPANTVDVLFVYGSEKQDWIDAIVPSFNGEQHTLPNGKIIHISPKPMGSGESKDDILAGRLQAVIWSPASGVFVTLANAESQSKGGPLLKRTQNLVLSPVVIAMWKPMAQALGWPQKAIGWNDIGALAAEKDAWKARGLPQFGQFKFGHTHPEFSNSGLIALLAETYAAAGKARGLSLDDLQNPDVATKLRKIEHGVVHYGRSTGFFGKRMADFGPGYLSAAVMYENMVVGAYGATGGSTPLVAIYPKEGTIWSDHPAGIVERPWVTDDQRAAGLQFINYLRAPVQQKMALQLGFRPAEGDVGSPIDPEHGADAKQPSTILDTPSADVITAAIQLWHREKKPSNIALVFDTSGSMNELGKMRAAQAGAKALINLMNPEDRLTLVPFSNDVRMGKPTDVGPHRAELLSAVAQLYADGGTNLYQAIASADDAVQGAADGSDHANCIVTVLSFGDFRVYMAGDLTWNMEAKLVYPVDLVGKVDVYQVTHHGLDQSNNPTVVQAITPAVAIIGNGPAKGSDPHMFETLKSQKSITGIYQIHKNLNGKGTNGPDEYIANLKPTDQCDGNYIKLSTDPNAKSYVVSIPAMEQEATFKTTAK